MAYSLYTGKEIGEGATVTGGISGEGLVLPVGGLYEKAISAKMNGVQTIITPLQSVEEKLMLEGISGISIYEVEDAEELIAFFFEGEVPEERPLELELEPIENLTEYKGERVPEMGGIVEALIRGEKNEIADIGDESVREYFVQKSAQHEEIYGMGYDYAAANGAFLTQISAGAIAEVERPDVDARKVEVQECLDSLERPGLTLENYQWVMGGEAREMRARNNFEKYSEYEAETKDEEYLLVYQMGYSRAWCEAAKAMYEAVGEEGVPADESKFRRIAERILNSSDGFGEWGEYADTGRDLYEEGMYAGAVYELVFAESMHEGDLELEEGVPESRYREGMENESISVWGKVFRGHSSYLYQQGSKEDAYRMMVFAENMDEVVGEIGHVEAEEGETGGFEESGHICAPAFLILVAVFAAMGEKH
jgi:hypothetical protein